MALWLGLSLHDWASLTPRELFALLDGAMLRAGQHHEDLAWQTALLLQPWSKQRLTASQLLGGQPTVAHRLLARRQERRQRLGLPPEEGVM